MIRTDVEAVARDAQIVGEKFLPDMPPSWDFQMKAMQEGPKVFGKWIEEQGK